MLQLCLISQNLLKWDCWARVETLSWLLLIVFLYWYLGIWLWKKCNSRCWYLVLLGRCFFFFFLVSLVLSSSKESAVAVFCLVGNFFWGGPTRCSHLGFTVQIHNWEPILNSRKGLEGVVEWEIYRTEESRVFQHDVLSLPEWNRVKKKRKKPKEAGLLQSYR